MLSQKVGIPSLFLLHSIPLCKYIRFLIHSSTDGHLGCFQLLAIVNSAAMNIGVHMFFQIGVLGFLGYIPSNGITGSKVVPFLIFFSDCTTLHSHQQCTRLPFPPHPRQHLLFVNILMIFIFHFSSNKHHYFERLFCLFLFCFMTPGLKDYADKWSQNCFVFTL